MHFCHIFADRSLSERGSMKGAAHCFFLTALSNKQLRKVLLVSYLNLHFCRTFSDESLCTRHSVKGAGYCSFGIALQNSYFGKVSLITFINTLNKILMHCIVTDSLLIVNCMQWVLWKELLIATFVEPLKMLLWENLIILPVLGTI